MNLVVVCASLMLIALLLLIPAPAQKISFLDVGQGDSILLQDGTLQILIDGGAGDAVLEPLSKELPWFDRRIEMLVLTHAQKDHMEGFLHILERYEVGSVLLPEVAHTSLMYEEFLEKIISQEIPYQFARRGQSFQAGDMYLEILGPFMDEAGQAAIKSDLNNASVVMRLDYNDLSVLLMGDAEKRIETMLVAADTGNLGVDVLKVGHHGSDSSTHFPLLKAANPKLAVISVGADNKFGHPREEVLARLGQVPIWRTDEQGTINLLFEDDAWLLGPQRQH